MNIKDRNFFPKTINLFDLEIDSAVDLANTQSGLIYYAEGIVPDTLTLT